MATSAIPIAIPECPELAAATASRVSARIAAAFFQWAGFFEASALRSTAKPFFVG